MATPTAMLLNGAADMTGSTLAVILIPPVGTICLAAWLALVFYAGRTGHHHAEPGHHRVTGEPRLMARRRKH